MKDENSLELVNNGNYRKIHEKKPKHTRTSVEESAATVEEVTPKRKKKRTAQKSAIIYCSYIGIAN